jgi:hypothetical protein
MAILKPKRGSGSPSGLQQFELAVDIANRRIFLGNTGGTGDIVSSHITDYVSTLNSATGAVNLYAGSGLSVATSTAIKGITFTNTGVLSIDSATGAITNVARTNVAQTFTALQTFTRGVSGSTAYFDQIIIPRQTTDSHIKRISVGFYGSISETASGAAYIQGNAIAASVTSNNAVVKTSSNSDPANFIRMRYDQGVSVHTGITGNVGTTFADNVYQRLRIDNNGDMIIGTGSPSSTYKVDIVGAMRASQLITASSGISASGATFSALTRFNSGISAAGGTFSGTQTFINGATFSGRANFTAGICASSGMTLNGTLNLNGTTYSTNIARTNASNIFTATQFISGFSARLDVVDTFTADSISLDPINNKINFLDDDTGLNITLYADGFADQIITFPAASTRLAGVASTQTFTGTNTFSSSANFSAGISASGGITFNSPIISTRLPRHSSTIFETKTADFSPAEADNGKIFIVTVTGKGTVTITFDGLSVGWRAKFLCTSSGQVTFTSSLGTVVGTYGFTTADSFAPIIEVICYGTDLYYAG